jgi:hypothetical protein
MSYITGGHHTKVGWDVGYYRQDQQNQMNDSRLFYHYQKPATNCATLAPLETYPCGNTSLQYPTDPFNLALRPVPLNVQFFTGLGTVRDRVCTARFTPRISGRSSASRSAARCATTTRSRYLSTCIGGPTAAHAGAGDGTKKYCTPDTDGVSYDDITPRWGAVWTCSAPAGRR